MQRFKGDKKQPEVRWSDLEAMVTNLAVAFWTRCNLSSSQDGNPYKMELQGLQNLTRTVTQIQPRWYCYMFVII